MLTGITFRGVIKKRKRAILRLPGSLLSICSIVVLHQTGLLQCDESTVLGNCLQGAGCELNSHKAVKFRNPDPFGLQVGGEQSRGIGGYVLTDAAFLLGHTAPVDDVALARFGTCNTAFSRHKQSFVVKSSEDPQLCPHRQGQNWPADGVSVNPQITILPPLAQQRTCATVAL
jgi:hypothetical protein